MKIFTYIKDNSSRVERKNFRILGDLPLWKHNVLELSTIGDFYIDTDSQEVLREVMSDIRLNKVFAYERKKEYIQIENDSQANSPALMMTRDFLETYVEDDEEIVVLTHVTSPFLTKETVMRAVQKLGEGYEFVHSITSKKDFAWLENYDNPINFDKSVVQRTQNLKEVCFSNGAFFIFRKKHFLKYNNRLGNKNYFYKLNHLEGIEIDTMDDLKFAKLIFEGGKNGFN